MEALVLLAPFLVILAFLAYLANQPSNRRRRSRSAIPRREAKSAQRRLQVLANHLHRGRVVRTGYRQGVQGTFAGRAVRVEISEINELGAPEDGLTLYAFAESFEGLHDLELRVVALPEGGYHAAYQGETPQSTARAGQVLSNRDVKRALGQLFEDLDVRRLEIAGDRVEVERPGRDRDLAPERVKRLLRPLTALLRGVEETLKKAPALTVNFRSADDIDWSERFCPYCKDSLESDDRVSCEGCSTVMHDECYAELGKCTTFGCEGRRGLPVVGDAGPARIVISGFTCEECGLRSNGCTQGECNSTARERMLHRVRERGGRRRARQRARISQAPRARQRAADLWSRPTSITDINAQPEPESVESEPDIYREIRGRWDRPTARRPEGPQPF
ncbi:MAG TPA: hypothetical protein DEA08_24950 [Planctomycetes bacterium]|nr:hypothetical protein [Planctomycetota bacterium]